MHLISEKSVQRDELLKKYHGIHGKARHLAKITGFTAVAENRGIHGIREFVNFH
jgi:hypothetical protein